MKELIDALTKQLGVSGAQAEGGAAVLFKAAKDKLDAHTREMVEWHFNPETGCPFWLEKAKTYSFDPRKDVKCFDDLKKFPLFEDDWLRGGPVKRWLPRESMSKLKRACAPPSLLVPISVVCTIRLGTCSWKLAITKKRKPSSVRKRS